jgi:dUTP pyrophosphatase
MCHKSDTLAIVAFAPVSLKIELKILDPRLRDWGFPRYGSDLAAGLDLHACLDQPLLVRPQAPAVLISAGFAFRIGDPEWCALVLPRSGLGHREGLVLGNAVGLIDADYEGACLISAWNRNRPQPGNAGDGDGFLIRPGDRIAQLVFTRVARPDFTVVDEFSATGRRQTGGFGSTGVASACRKSPER